jgi:hypothetical protein
VELFDLLTLLGIVREAEVMEYILVFVVILSSGKEDIIFYQQSLPVRQ